MPKRVWVLGAGASKEMGYPLGNELLAEIADYPAKETEHDVVAMLFGRIVDSIKSIYGINGDRKDIEKIDYEEYFSCLRLLDQGYLLDALDSVETPRKYMDYFLRLFYWFGWELTRSTKEKLGKIERGSKEKVFRNLVKKMQDENDLVVTFNQDILIESFVGNFLYSYNPDDIDNPELLSLIKMHGSINWSLLRNDEVEKDKHALFMKWDELEMGIYETGEMQKISHNEKIGDVPSVCMMMLPDSFKGMPVRTEMRLVFQRMYNAAFEQLKKANQVIIVGFSARSTDYLASMLLNMGLRGKSEKQIIIVDPAANIPEGIGKNIKQFTHVQKPFLEWVGAGGIEALPKVG